jgi:outer membrane immunogenic protein
VSPVFAQSRTIDIPASAYGPVWTGVYVGAAFGVDTLLDRANVSAGNGSALNFDGLAGRGPLGSIYGGVDYQIIPKALVGVLAEVSYGGLDSNTAAALPGASATFSSHADLSWAALFRAGVLPRPSTLLYVVGGYAGQNLQTNATAQVGNAFANFSQSTTFNGWTVGAGIESKLQGGWSTKLEYRYSQYGQQTLPGTMISLSPSTQAIRLGLAYKFGGGDVQPADDGLAGERAMNWTGLYGGVAGGAGIFTSHNNATLPGLSASADTGAQGVLGSVFAGADYQFSNQALVGIMGDLTWPGMQATSTTTVGGAIATVQQRANMGWSMLGRIGFIPMPSTLIYAAAGFTSMTFTTSVTGAGAFATRDDTANGWTLAPGFEIQVADGWTTRFEYRYSEFGQISSINGVSFQPSMQSVRAGLSYKFGGGH